MAIAWLGCLGLLLSLSQYTCTWKDSIYWSKYVTTGGNSTLSYPCLSVLPGQSLGRKRIAHKLLPAHSQCWYAFSRLDGPTMRSLFNTDFSWTEICTRILNLCFQLDKCDNQTCFLMPSKHHVDASYGCRCTIFRNELSWNWCWQSCLLMWFELTLCVTACQLHQLGWYIQQKLGNSYIYFPKLTI